MTAYTPGLIVSPEVKIEKLRELALIGKTLVNVGDTVRHDTLVLSAEIPADIAIIRLPDRTGIDASRIQHGLLCKVGDFINKGDLIFRLKTCFGLFTTTLKTPVSGTVEFFNSETGHLGIRPAAETRNIAAYISGTVTEVVENRSVKIETVGALIQGIFGLSGERFGKIVALDVSNNAVVTVEHLSVIAAKHLSVGANVGADRTGNTAHTTTPHIGPQMLQNAILIGGKTFTLDALNFAVQNGVAGIVTGSITSKTLDDFLGYKLGLAMTGDEKIGLTLIITEGFGEIAISQRVMDLSRRFNGHIASVNGATQVRAGAMRPELIVSRGELLFAPDRQESYTTTFTIGSIARITQEPYFGKFARIIDLPAELTTIETGAKVRVAQVELLDGTNCHGDSSDTGSTSRPIFIPRANLEL